MLPALRVRIAEVLSPSKQPPPGLPTGLGVLDALLPGGGIPVGRLTEVVAPRGGGRTTVLRTIVRTTVRQGGWVAVIDASRTLCPLDWTARALGVSRLRSRTIDHRPLVSFIRPRRAERAAWCADLLLRTGAFTLVVIDGAAPLSRAVAARLTRLARDAGSALIVAAELPEGARTATHLPGALRLWVERQGPGVRSRGSGSRLRIPNPGPRIPITLTITIEKGGPRRRLEVSYAVPLAHRLCAHPQIPDRRGVAKSAGSGIRDSGSGSRTHAAALAGADAGSSGPGVRDPGFGKTHRARTRRCAEPVYERERLRSEHIGVG